MSFSATDEKITDRIIKEAVFICQNRATVRMAATFFGISKSCVHKDVTERLKLLDEQLYKEVRRVLDRNFAEKHLRGGEATKRKYARRRSDQAQI